jgi:hypothetical protein
MMAGTLGDTYIDAVLGEYIPINESNTPLEELLTDESDQLLFAVLSELRASRYQTGQYDIQAALATGESETIDKSATYETVTVDADPLQDSDDWVEIDLDFVTQEVDIRFDDAVYVVFQKQFGSDDVIAYSADDSPIAGIPVSTSWIYVAAQDGTTGATIQLEAWGDN